LGPEWNKTRKVPKGKEQSIISEMMLSGSVSCADEPGLANKELESEEWEVVLCSLPTGCPKQFR
jgi:hypothetical protein